MFRTLYLILAIFGVIPTVSAGKIDIEIDLEGKCPRMRQTQERKGDTCTFLNPGYCRLQSENGWASDAGAELSYDKSAHKVHITGVTTEYFEQNPQHCKSERDARGPFVHPDFLTAIPEQSHYFYLKILYASEMVSGSFMNGESQGATSYEFDFTLSFMADTEKSQKATVVSCLMSQKK